MTTMQDFFLRTTVANIVISLSRSVPLSGPLLARRTKHTLATLYGHLSVLQKVGIVEKVPKKGFTVTKLGNEIANQLYLIQ